VEAAVELHTTVGPAHTTDAAVAKRANVTRMTFYRHFPSDASLFRACTTHGLRRWPPPDPHSWRRIADPEARLRLALRELYEYYRVAGPGLVAIVRDAPLLRPELLAFPGRMSVLRSMSDVLLEGRKARGRQRRQLTPPHEPDPSAYIEVLRDPASHRIVLLTEGGTPPGVPAPTETWSWNGQDWTRVGSTGKDGGIVYAVPFEAADRPVIWAFEDVTPSAGAPRIDDAWILGV
jgi:AcrR family transcriptional regulator